MPTSIAVASPATGIWDRVLAVISNRQLIVVTIFSLAGLSLAVLFTVYLPFRFPNLGALTVQYDQF
jgi:hypothetical protein